jgi:hypothetical protein
MDVPRARAFLDLVLGKDFRPAADWDAAAAGGFAGRATLTVPLATLLDLADRPGEIPGIGPIDPWLARDLADATAQPQVHVVHDRHGPARSRHRARLCPAWTRGPQDRERAGSTGVHLHPHQPGWAAH